LENPKLRAGPGINTKAEIHSDQDVACYKGIIPMHLGWMSICAEIMAVVFLAFAPFPQ